ncbi:MAG: C-GCAxxG-C-C family protein [Eubacterium sp.]|nr:C-GCAxxG-C-C family protein [Eubacterium sp.]
MNKGELAESYFRSGCNCAQSVALAFCDEMNMKKEDVARLTIGFGGGIGRLREVCGTVSGMAFVISAIYGESDKGGVYAMIQTVAKEFEQENGSIVCRELLGLGRGSSSPVPESRTAQYYKKRPCSELVHMAADILDNFLKNQSC